MIIKREKIPLPLKYKVSVDYSELKSFKETLKEVKKCLKEVNHEVKELRKYGLEKATINLIIGLKFIPEKSKLKEYLKNNMEGVNDEQSSNV